MSGATIVVPAGGQRAALALPALVAVLVTGLVLQGAFYEPQLAMVLALASIAAVVAGVRAPRATAGFAALATGLLASAIATGFDARAAKPAGTLALAAVCAAIARAVRRHEGTGTLLDVAVVAGAVVALTGLAGVAAGIDSLALRADTWRLTSTLTYQNAAGAVLAIALVPALVRASASRRHAAAAVAIAAALAATLSRGALFAAAVAIGLAVVLSPGARIAMARLAPAMLVAAGAAAPAVVGAPWAWVSLAIGLTLAAGLAVRPPTARVASAVLAGGVVALVVAGAATPLRDRFTFSSTDRARVWSATLDRIDGDVLAFGTGPGTYELIAPAGGRLVRTAHAHNEYLQALAETGLAGLAAIGAALALFARAAWRARPQGGDARARWAAAVAACSVLVVHAGFDFVWRVPVVVALGSVMLAAASEEDA